MIFKTVYNIHFLPVFVSNSFNQQMNIFEMLHLNLELEITPVGYYMLSIR